MAYNTAKIRDVSIVDIASQYYSVKKEGNKYFMKCKHAGEKNASLCLYPETNSFYCFGCQAGKKSVTNGSGNIEFLMYMQDLSYQEAVEKIADIGNIQLSPVYAMKRDEQEKEILFLSEQKDIFHAQLLEQPRVLDYLYNRGLTDRDIRRHELGWVQFDNTEFMNYVGHISYPVYNPNGETIAFVFRNVITELTGKPNDLPKYRNTKNSSIFTKSKTLYGFDKVKDLIKEKNYVIIGEGNHDMISCQRHGIPFISVLGTNFNDFHLSLIERYTKNIIFWYDGDTAGENALYQSYLKTLHSGFNVRCIKTTGYDPDEFILSLEEEILANDQIENIVLNSVFDFSYQMVNQSIQEYLNTLAQAQRKLMLDTKDIINSSKGTPDHLILLNLVNNILNLNKEQKN